MIERERHDLQQEREKRESAILTQKFASLEMGHRRKQIAHENKLVQEMNALKERCARELDHAKDKHQREYRMLIEETAQRSYGGVSSCQCQKRYLCSHNATASYNTRKPTHAVIKMRANAERVRASGRNVSSYLVIRTFIQRMRYSVSHEKPFKYDLRRRRPKNLT
jgi:hypothetical protein